MIDSVKNTITESLKNALSPGFMSVENESHMHSVPENSETHFKVTLVAEKFEGKRPVQRHQLVYGLLNEQLNSGVHALALHLYTPKEWEEKGNRSPDSPMCMGGSKNA